MTIARSSSMVDFVPCAEAGLAKSILVIMVVDRSCSIVERGSRLSSPPPIELLLRRLAEPSTSMSTTAVALFDSGIPTECVVCSRIMRGK